MLITLLKISQSGLSKQAQICQELINAIKISILNTDEADSSVFIKELRDKVGKIINIM
jgi:hypothetical protein